MTFELVAILGALYAISEALGLSSRLKANSTLALIYQAFSAIIRDQRGDTVSTRPEKPRVWPDKLAPPHSADPFYIFPEPGKTGVFVEVKGLPAGTGVQVIAHEALRESEPALHTIPAPEVSLTGTSAQAIVEWAPR